MTLYIKKCFLHQGRPHHSDGISSYLLSKVKRCQARLALWWGTTLETLVMFILERFL